MNKTYEPNNCVSTICEMVAENWTKVLKKNRRRIDEQLRSYACNHLYFSTL